MQCDAIIGLVDDEYHTRAWCSVEALLVQTIKKSYGMHYWYEQVKTAEGWALQEGPIDLEISIAEKTLSFEKVDRPKVMFLGLGGGGGGGGGGYVGPGPVFFGHSFLALYLELFSLPALFF